MFICVIRVFFASLIKIAFQTALFPFVSVKNYLPQHNEFQHNSLKSFCNDLLKYESTRWCQSRPGRKVAVGKPGRIRVFGTNRNQVKISWVPVLTLSSRVSRASYFADVYLISKN